MYYLAYGLTTLDNCFKYYQLITQNEHFCYSQQEERESYQQKFQSMINGLKIKIGIQSSNFSPSLLFFTIIKTLIASYYNSYKRS
ncbi:hypothetical protein K4S08_07435, partial [Staphylococcus epidermidis]|nr:hypothetical protein [Staphylococcus epidermidis]MCG1496009.1 hypothetical protein [Staphylococcus epidermidis]MCG1559237.1 hypothetical protein [Staphylococcus epidermidis]MCG2398914.1 hypothetical protein [Staphylococcus epidermidis]MCG2433792.1 hypothetical protein [Staphylococcus epidermidis]